MAFFWSRHDTNCVDYVNLVVDTAERQNGQSLHFVYIS
jgi:hypothetical protein